MADTGLTTNFVPQYDAREGGPYNVARGDYVGFFYIDENSDLVVERSTDGGSSFSQTVLESTLLDLMGMHVVGDWEHGINPNSYLVHIVFYNQDTTRAYYMGYDLKTGSITQATTEIVNFGAIIEVDGTYTPTQIAVTTTGRIYVVVTANTDDQFLKSDDGGATWDLLTSGHVGGDHVRLLPDLWAADADDLVAVYGDVANNGLTLKLYDASAGTWSEPTTIIADASWVDSTFDFRQFDATWDYTNERLYIVVHSEYNSATGDFLAFELTDSSTVNSLTNIVTNSANQLWPSICFSQPEGKLYVSWASGPIAGTTSDAALVTSNDRGSTWTPGTNFNDTAYDLRNISLPKTIDHLGGTILAVFSNDDLNDALTNLTNVIAVAAGAGLSGGLNGGHKTPFVPKDDGVPTTEPEPGPPWNAPGFKKKQGGGIPDSESGNYPRFTHPNEDPGVPQFVRNAGDVVIVG